VEQGIDEATETEVPNGAMDTQLTQRQRIASRVRSTSKHQGTDAPLFPRRAEVLGVPDDPAGSSGRSSTKRALAKVLPEGSQQDTKVGSPVRAGIKNVWGRDRGPTGHQQLLGSCCTSGAKGMQTTHGVPAYAWPLSLTSVLTRAMKSRPVATQASTRPGLRERNQKVQRRRRKPTAANQKPKAKRRPANLGPLKQIQRAGRSEHNGSG
jgi:hypothetical protein